MKNTHGGKRENAGRKPISQTGEPRVSLHITVDPEDFKNLEGLNRREVFDLGLKVAIPAVKGDSDTARGNLDNFLAD